jgi:hypothetical protein
MPPPVDSPTGPPAGPPTPTAISPSPTSENSIAIKALPFNLTYAPSSNVPSTADFAQLAEVTRVYLKEYMINEFETTTLTNLDDFLTIMISNEFEAGEPVLAVYESTGLFNPSSKFLPTARELNQLIARAFIDENLPGYLQRVRNLPRSNPFSDTDEIEISSPTFAILIIALPFALTYAPSSNEPSLSDFFLLAEITQAYMEDYMFNEFEGTQTNLTSFPTNMISNEFEAGEPVLAVYGCSGFFSPSSQVLPTVRELNQLIAEAFNNENLPGYLQRVRNLPRSNPFSDTDEIEYSEVDGSSSGNLARSIPFSDRDEIEFLEVNVPRSIPFSDSDEIAFSDVDGSSSAKSQDSVGSFVRAGVTAAILGVVVLVVGLTMMRSQSRGCKAADDQTIAPLKKLSGNTVAGETCNMSMDGSSVAQSWKTPIKGLGHWAS